MFLLIFLHVSIIFLNVSFDIPLCFSWLSLMFLVIFLNASLDFPYVSLDFPSCSSWFSCVFVPIFLNVYFDFPEKTPGIPQAPPRLPPGSPKDPPECPKAAQGRPWTRKWHPEWAPKAPKWPPKTSRPPLKKLDWPAREWRFQYNFVVNLSLEIIGSVLRFMKFNKTKLYITALALPEWAFSAAAAHPVPETSQGRSLASPIRMVTPPKKNSWMNFDLVDQARSKPPTGFPRH